MRGVAETEVAPAPGERDGIARLAAIAQRLVDGASIARCVGELVAAVAEATGAEVVIARTLEAGGRDVVARAVHAESPALAAELEASRLPVGEVPLAELALAADDERLPATIRRDAARALADAVRVHPLTLDGAPVGTLELYGAETAFTREEMLGRLAAAHLGVAVRLERGAAHGTAHLSAAGVERVVDALAAGADETETAEHIVRLAVETTGAAASALWRLEADTPPSYLTGQGLDGEVAELREAAENAARVAGAEGRRHTVAPLPGAGPEDAGAVVTIALGEPPVGALQLLFDDRRPGLEEIDVLSAFTARAALALRRSRRVGLIATALRRSQTVIGVVSQAIAQLSLTHTLETAVERIAELAATGHVGVYLREGERLTAAASRGLTGDHTELAERLLELALGPFRGRGYLFIEDMLEDRRLKDLEAVLSEIGIRRAILIPLIVHDEVIGALGVFKTRPRRYREGEEGLLIALSRQLAVAVQNARLHERTKELGTVLEQTLEAERRAARQLRGLYEISQSFAESLSLEATLDAVARTMVNLFGVDAAAIRMPDERSGELELRALSVPDAKLRELAPTLIGRPQPLSAPLTRRLLRSRRPILLQPGKVSTGDAHHVLDPFLRKGSTAIVVPLATPTELLGTLTLLSLDPSRPLDADAADTAMTVASQAALAIDNARLYQQQKDFSETMQRSLLPRALPHVPGLEVGHVYESAARVDVGGDVYDFLPLEDGRLAVALGDVTGKGIAAAADMAMAKFSFRALARANPEPSEFLAAVNDVVAEEVETGKFVTMLYVLIDPERREVACACAGHPPARVVSPHGDVSELAARGLALGIASGEEYASEQMRLEAGSTVVLYTDGVIEARRDGELYGEARLDEALRRLAGRGAQELAEGVLEECRAFAGGDLGDDCAVVCLRLS
jgi:serine phosphatase RsbU (regulator of sigma subunit)